MCVLVHEEQGVALSCYCVRWVPGIALQLPDVVASNFPWATAPQITILMKSCTVFHIAWINAALFIVMQPSKVAFHLLTYKWAFSLHFIICSILHFLQEYQFQRRMLCGLWGAVSVFGSWVPEAGPTDSCHSKSGSSLDSKVSSAWPASFPISCWLHRTVQSQLFNRAFLSVITLLSGKLPG